MRSDFEVQDFRFRAAKKYGEETPAFNYYVACYESSIPQSFWAVAVEHVRHNRGVFADVLRYCKRNKKALAKGYSLALLGDNGTGKTMFLSYILTQMVRRGRTVYYTTLAQLDADIKRGFDDRDHERRLRTMLTSDFLAIDELGKEYGRSRDTYVKTQFELVLKQRYDDNEPVLLASNLSFEDLDAHYGSSIVSMLEGKFHVMTMESGDYRKTISARMKREMGFEDV